MGPLDAFWHLLNFAAPALGAGLLAAALGKLIWWRGLRPVAWWRLAAWTVSAGLVALLGSLLLLERDGRMAGYVALVVAVALALWWRGLRHLP